MPVPQDMVYITDQLLVSCKRGIPSKLMGSGPSDQQETDQLEL